MDQSTRDQITTAFDDLTQDIEDLTNKPWLKCAINCHLKGKNWCPNVNVLDIATIVDERIPERLRQR